MVFDLLEFCSPVKWFNLNLDFIYPETFRPTMKQSSRREKFWSLVTLVYLLLMFTSCAVI